MTSSSSGLLSSVPTDLSPLALFIVGNTFLSTRNISIVADLRPYPSMRNIVSCITRVLELTFLPQLVSGLSVALIEAVAARHWVLIP